MMQRSKVRSSNRAKHVTWVQTELVKLTAGRIPDLLYAIRIPMLTT